MSFWVSVCTPSRFALAWAASNLISVFWTTLGAGEEAAVFARVGAIAPVGASVFAVFGRAGPGRR